MAALPTGFDTSGGMLIMRVSLWFVFALAACSAGIATPSAAANRNCTAVEKADGDRWLWLNAKDQALSIKSHLPWGIPASNAEGDRLLVQRDYVNLYSTSLRVPLWSAERLTYSEIGKVDGRVNCFRKDPRLPPEQASLPSDFDEPIYDQGHMTPDADQDKTVRSAVNTYVMSNMAPQNCQLNRGIWQILEGITRLWARKNKVVYVLSGSVFDRDGDGRRDPDAAAPRMLSRNKQARVAIPSAFYKIIAVERPNGRIETLSVLLPHTTANPNGPDALAYLRAHVTTIATLEALTGYDLFPDAANVNESSAFWAFEGNQPRSLCNLPSGA
ncbi:DNA/RNA non-specific endonuclease [Sphingomonas sp. CJ20]